MIQRSITVLKSTDGLITITQPVLILHIKPCFHINWNYPRARIKLKRLCDPVKCIFFLPLTRIQSLQPHCFGPSALIIVLDCFMDHPPPTLYKCGRRFLPVLIGEVIMWGWIRVLAVNIVASSRILQQKKTGQIHY